MPKVIFDALTTSGDFAAAARSISTRGTSLKSDGQKALICALVHTDTHGDYTSSILPLLDAIKTAFGKNLHVAAQEWVLKYSWLRYDETTGKMVKDQSKVMKIEDAKTKMWWSTERPAKAVPFDAQKKVDSLFAAFDTAVTDGIASMPDLLELVLRKVAEKNPTFIVDQFSTLEAEEQNEILAVLVARTTAANDETVVEEPVAEAIAA